MQLKFQSERVCIRPLRPSDAPDIYDNVKDKEVVKWTQNIPHPYPEDDALKFIRKSRHNINKRKSFAFGIVLKITFKVIGVVELMRVDWENKNAELGYFIGNKYWRKGIVTEAVGLAVKFGFEELKLHRIYANVFKTNIASSKVLEKAGFSLEGRMRQERYRYGKWHDILKYGVLRLEF